MKYALVFVISLLFSGCISSIPPKIEFRVNSKVDVKPIAQNGCKDKSLKIAQAFSSSSLLSKDMSYRLGDYKQYKYSEALWSISPNRAITMEFLSLIRNSKLFKSVQVSKSRSRSDVILEINIEDFMQYFNNNSTLSHVNVVISVSLINARKNSVFDTQTFSKKIKVKELNSRAGVEGLNIALNDVLKQSNLWLGDVCK